MKTTVTFDEVSLHAKKSGKCGCGKQRTRSRKFWQTLSPFNTNANNVPKTRAEILAELRGQAEMWKQEPISCADCVFKRR